MVVVGASTDWVGLIRADTLWTQLKRMGINEFDNSHPVFGNIKEAIQTLVKQRYVTGFRLLNSSRYFLFYLRPQSWLSLPSKRTFLRFGFGSGSGSGSERLFSSNSTSWSGGVMFFRKKITFWSLFGCIPGTVVRCPGIFVGRKFKVMMVMHGCST